MPSIDYSDITQPVSQSFQRLDTKIQLELESQVPLIKQVATYTTGSGGKRIRPLLTLLSAKACGYLAGENDETMAIIVEFLHTASLLHDDVVDNSPLRRGQPSAQNQWGNATSVLVGDFIYARAFELLVGLEQPILQKTVAHAIKTITEGEVFQLLNKGNTSLSEVDYFQIIHGKTAAMFSAAAECGAQIAKAPLNVQTALANYAVHLGCAFQIIDDLLDYTGSADTLGKQLGQDLSEKKLTLPLIYALKLSPPQQRKTILTLLEQGHVHHNKNNPSQTAERCQNDFATLTTILHESGAILKTQERAEQETNKALSELSLLEHSPFKTSLINLVQFSTQRYY